MLAHLYGKPRHVGTLEWLIAAGQQRASSLFCHEPVAVTARLSLSTQPHRDAASVTARQLKLEPDRWISWSILIYRRQTRFVNLSESFYPIKKLGFERTQQIELQS